MGQGPRDHLPEQTDQASNSPGPTTAGVPGLPVPGRQTSGCPGRRPSPHGGHAPLTPSQTCAVTCTTSLGSRRPIPAELLFLLRSQTRRLGKAGLQPLRSPLTPSRAVRGADLHILGPLTRGDIVQPLWPSPGCRPPDSGPHGPAHTQTHGCVTPGTGPWRREGGGPSHPHPPEAGTGACACLCVFAPISRDRRHVLLEPFRFPTTHTFCPEKLALLFCSKAASGRPASSEMGGPAQKSWLAWGHRAAHLEVSWLSVHMWV